LAGSPTSSSRDSQTVSVSVVVPVRNGEAFVADAIESVLDQEDVSAELIVVDDGSTDGTADVLARYDRRIAVADLEGRGVSAARNRGMALGRGELLVFLDADDLLPPRYLARFVEAAAAAPRAQVFHCGWRGVDFEDGRALYGQDQPFDLDRDPFHVLAAAGSPPISALAVRRTAATRVGPFDENESLQADWDYWLRLAASGETFRGVPGNVAIIRRRDVSMSGSAGTELAVAGLAVLERHLSRHRRCAACVHADAGLRSWREAVLRSSARDYAHRLRLGGRTGRLVGAAVAVAYRPRLASTAWLALRDRRRAV
jgi:glycosyltransferase involved in cell wall biosynthesis